MEALHHLRHHKKTMCGMSPIKVKATWIRSNVTCKRCIEANEKIDKILKKRGIL